MTIEIIRSILSRMVFGLCKNRPTQKFRITLIKFFDNLVELRARAIYDD